MVPPAERRKPMKNTIARLAGALLALTLTTGFAAAQSKVTVAIGGGFWAWLYDRSGSLLGPWLVC